MRIFKAWALGVGLCGLLGAGCREEPKKSHGPDPVVVALRRDLSRANEQIEDLERQVGRVDDQRQEAQEELRANRQRPEIVLQHRLDVATAESGAVLGWLKAAKRAASLSTGLEESSDLEIACDRAEKCIQELDELGSLYSDYRKKLRNDDGAQEDLDVMATQWDWLKRNAQEMQAELKNKP